MLAFWLLSGCFFLFILLGCISNVMSMLTEDRQCLHDQAAIAQLGERQTEDLKVPGSIPGLGTLFT